ncbi:MAG TPA: hypothetical protein VFE02_01465 [Candidatus Acidoferrales bacterium]|jgi:hypothetical protein|nr:hypothetical protein [Candidatus Acidoferrales bacterium]
MDKEQAIEQIREAFASNLYPGDSFLQGSYEGSVRCAFLIHLEPYGTSQTKVEIFEYQPEVWVGQYLGFSAHSIFPVFLDDIRRVPATAADRNDVLSVVKAAVGNPRE